MLLRLNSSEDFQMSSFSFLKSDKNVQDRNISKECKKHLPVWKKWGITVFRTNKILEQRKFQTKFMNNFHFFFYHIVYSRSYTFS